MSVFILSEIILCVADILFTYFSKDALDIRLMIPKTYFLIAQVYFGHQQRPQGSFHYFDLKTRLDKK